MKTAILYLLAHVNDLWTWLNGRKTVIGTFLAVLYVGALSQGLIARNEAAEWFITSTLGVGLADKIRKG